eukprot:1222275-Prymnesium_polylepis.3
MHVLPCRLQFPHAAVVARPSPISVSALAVGGTDSSPGMRYKASVAEQTLRPAYSLLHAEAQAAGAPRAERLRPGSVPLRNVCERDLLNL